MFQVVAFREDYEPQGGGRGSAPSALARVKETLEGLLGIGQRIIGSVEGKQRERLNAALIDVRNAGTQQSQIIKSEVQAVLTIEAVPTITL